MRTGINKLWFFILISILGSVMLFTGGKHPITAAPNVPLETPITMVSGANQATIYKSVIYYYQVPYCPPIGPNATDTPADAADPVVIIRQRTTDYERRTLFSRNDPRPAGECNPYDILSNLVVDDDYVYWLDAQGLARIPHTSNAGDPVEHVINVPILQTGELVDGGDHIYGTFEGHLFGYNKLTGDNFSLGDTGSTFTQLKYDRLFFYYLLDGKLIRVNPANAHNSETLFNDISSYAVPGVQKVCGNGALQWAVSDGGLASYRYLAYAFTPLEDLRFGDFNGDGKTDVFTTSLRNDGKWQWVYSSAGEANYVNLAYADQPLEDLRFGDFNGDGKTDVFTAVDQDNGYHQWYYSPGGVGSYIALTSSTIPLEDLRFGDFNGDGKTDVFATLPRNDGNLQWVYSSAGVGSFTNLAYASQPLEDLRFGDFNGDGKTDVFTAVLQENGNYQWYYSAGGFNNYVALNQSSIPLTDLRFGDFNGDAKTDVFATLPRNDGFLQWAYSSGGVGGFTNIAYDGRTVDQLRFGDFNGDSKTDVFATLPRDGCKDVLPVFYAFKTTGTPGVGGNVYWWDSLSGNYGRLTITPSQLANSSKTFNYYDGLAFANNRLFWNERYSECQGGIFGCALLTTSQLYRANLTLDFYKGYTRQATDLLWQADATVNTPSYWPRTGLTADDKFIFWNFSPAPKPGDPTNNVLNRLAADAAALPVINMSVTGIEITQGIQDNANNVRLIRGKDTFVRVFVKSDGANVPDVTALLDLIVEGNPVGTIAPERRITVRNSPNRLDTDQSFLFRLPFWAISGGSLQVRARLNPGGFPLEPVNGASDNTMLSPNYPVYTSPRLGLLLAEFTYTLNGVTYRPQGTLANATWISRAYPLGYRLVGGEYEPGLEWNSVAVEDSQLGARVGRMLPQCEAYVVRDDKNNITEDNREFCASDYVNGRLARVRYLFGAPSSTFIYGEIPDSGLANFFPRGQAHEGRISSGPDAVGWNGFYAGHEVGHTAALGHPEQSIVAGCIDRTYELDKDGNPILSKPIRGDAKPTHPKAHIGPDDNSVNGLTYANFSGRWRWEVLPGSQWDDMMGYCNQPNWPYQWISDQNYERIYSFLTPVVADADVQQVPQVGDYLALFGSIAPAGNQAAIALFERWSEVMAMPDITAGEFVLRQFDQNDQLLSGVSFAAAEGTEGWRPFELVVPAEAGVARVAIVRASDNLVIAEQSISANMPTLSVPTAVLDGDEIQIAWQGSDADGDTLTYDVYASRDGAMFEPLQFGLSGASTTVTAAEIGGGSVVFRVIANDGVQTAAQDSAPLELSAQPPQIRSFDPACGFHINWGQVANLTADVWDMQDGLLPAEKLQWELNGVLVGSGPFQSYLSELRAGENTVTLSATNSADLTTTADCSFFVDDDLSVPAAELAITPATINWNVTSDNPVLQEVDIALVNNGSGTLTWTASETASWLTIDKIAGELPDSLHITANPATLQSQSLYSTVITIAAYNEDGQLYQTIELSVTLWMDQSGYTPPLNTPVNNKALYLPLVTQK